MNRSFHAFAVLLVSLAGGMIAAFWTSTLPSGRLVVHASNQDHSQSQPLFCSCNPESFGRLEQGCARDKTTGELYGCGLGLGKNGTNDKSVIGRTAHSATCSLIKGTVALRDAVAGIPWHELAENSKRLEAGLAAVQERLPIADSAPTEISDRSHEQEYAAAELAAAGFDPSGPNTSWLHLNERLAPLHRSISADVFRRATESILTGLKLMDRRWQRESRLWLVENGLHRQWDAVEEAVLAEERLAKARWQFEEQDFDRWFEDFPPSITRPNRLMNPIEPKDDSEDSRRIILATAKALEILSDLLHHTAANLTRQAEQDVAELHKLKSGIEERR